MALDRVARDERLLVVPDGFDLLPVLPDHCQALVPLPPRHRDPFDRMLIAQARAERLALLTRDRAIHRLPHSRRRGGDVRWLTIKSPA